MREEKWQDILGMIEEKYKLLNFKKEKIPEIKGGLKEIVEFETPKGRFRLERITRPKVIDKKTIYSKRIGGEVKVEYLYSQEEKTSQLKAFYWDDQKKEWFEIKEEKSFQL